MIILLRGRVFNEIMVTDIEMKTLEKTFSLGLWTSKFSHPGKDDMTDWCENIFQITIKGQVV